MSYLHLTARLRLQNIVLTTDFSDASKVAVGYAAAIARTYQGKVYAVHVIVPEVYTYNPPETLPQIEETVQRWAEEQMRTLMGCEQLRDVPHEGMVRHGEVWDALEQVISQHNADVIVTGTRGEWPKSGVATFLCTSQPGVSPSLQGGRYQQVIGHLSTYVPFH